MSDLETRLRQKKAADRIAELARLIEALHEHTAAVPALALRKNPDMLGDDDALWLRWRDVKKAIEGERG